MRVNRGEKQTEHGGQIDNIKVCVLFCHTFAFSMHGQRAQAALDWTSELGFFNKDHTKRTPSSWSMILQKESRNKKMKKS